MGATASRSSLNFPSSWIQVKTKTATELFTVTDYSKWERMPAHSALMSGKFSLGHGRYRLKVYPAGFDEESAGYVAIFVARDTFGSLRFHKDVKVLIEILDVAGNSAVFSNDTAVSEQTLADNGVSKGYVRFVKRTELEEASCVRADDTFTVRCTLSVNVKKTKKITYVSNRSAGEHTLAKDMCARNQE